MHLRRCCHATLGLFLVVGCGAAVCIAQAQSSGASATDGVQQVAPRPITETQLRQYFEDSMLLPASQQHIQDGLDQTRTKLPPWFPDSVWQDVKRDVAAVDLVKLLLPLYQQVFTEQDGYAMDLLFEGPTGHEYAQAALQSRLDAIHAGLEGSAAEAAAMRSDSEAKVEALQKQRVAELTPEQRAQLRALGSPSHRTTADGLKLDDQQNAIIQKKMNEVLHATLAAHNEELVAAQRAYQAKH
jgi:hypothetical protein